MPSICDQLSDLSDRLSRLEAKVEGEAKGSDNWKNIASSTWSRVTEDGWALLSHCDNGSPSVVIYPAEFQAVRDYFSSLLERT
jgi:hypothetical protein